MSHGDDPRLQDYLEQWLHRHRLQLRPATVKSYRTSITNHIRPHLGAMPLSQLTRRRIERLYSHLLEAGKRDGTGLSPGSIQIAHTVLRCALKDALLDGLIESNPALNARAPTRRPDAIEVDDGPQAWTAEQAGTFLAAVEDHRWRAVWHLALGTGARRGEVLGLRWCDVDLDDETVVIRRSLGVVDGTARLLPTKSSRSHALAIGPSVVEALCRRRDKHMQDRRQAGQNWADRWGLVFTQPDGAHIRPGRVTAEFRRIIEALPVPVIRLHDLRHTHVSILLALGVPIKVISERLGHASITTTMDTYAHLLPTMDRDAAAEFRAALREAE